MDLDQAVTVELSSWNKLLPPVWGDRSLVGSEADVARWLKSLTSILGTGRSSSWVEV